jgi:hypothetical protein
MNVVLAPSKSRHDSRIGFTLPTNPQANDSDILEEDLNSFLEK